MRGGLLPSRTLVISPTINHPTNLTPPFPRREGGPGGGLGPFSRGHLLPPPSTESFVFVLFLLELRRRGNRDADDYVGNPREGDGCDAKREVLAIGERCITKEQPFKREHAERHHADPCDRCNHHDLRTPAHETTA